MDSVAARFNLRYNEQKWLNATAQLIADDPQALKRFLDGDITVSGSTRFANLGGVEALARFDCREAVFEDLRQSTMVRQSKLGVETRD